ncbi:unnamed protein product [Caenorhabditis nigoni]
MSHANVYTDGACINQGLNNARAGYGVFWEGNEANNRSGRVDGHQDSNRAELRAANVAIKTAIDKGYKSVTIHSDSQFVQDAITGSGNFQSQPAQYRDLLQSTNDMVRHSSIQVNTQKVAAHSGVHGNDNAHQLATQGAKGN